MYFYTYKITLLKGSKAGHYYYGQHRTENLDDKYSGSGRILTDYYKKYGKIDGVTYTKEIIELYDNVEDLDKAEFELIGDKYKTDEFCLNLRSGGNKCGYSEKSRKKMSESHTGKDPWNKGAKGKQVHSEETRKKMSESHTGKVYSEESRKKMSESAKNRKNRNSLTKS